MTHEKIVEHIFFGPVKFVCVTRQLKSLQVVQVQKYVHDVRIKLNMKEIPDPLEVAK